MSETLATGISEDKLPPSKASAGLATHAVATAVLRPIQRLVRGFDQLLDGLGFRRGKARDADRDRGLELAALVDRDGLLDELAQALAEAGRGIERDRAQHDRELLAAEPRDDVLVAYGL